MTIGKVFLLVTYIFLVYRLYAQRSDSYKCDLPNIVVKTKTPEKFKFYRDSVKDIRSVFACDTINQSFIQYLSESSIDYSYNYIDMGEFTFSDVSINLKRGKIFIRFNKDRTINHIVCQDSCIETEVDVAADGRIVSKYYCDYSRPDNCYCLLYDDKGVLITKTYYTPFCYSNIKDSNILQRYEQMKTIPVKVITFDKEGQKISEQKIEIQ